MPGLDGTGPVGPLGHGRGRMCGMGWGRGGCRPHAWARAGAPAGWDSAQALEERLKAIDAERKAVESRLAELGKK